MEFNEDLPLLTASDVIQIIVEMDGRSKNIYHTIYLRHKRRDADIKRHKSKCDMLVWLCQSSNKMVVLFHLKNLLAILMFSKTKIPVGFRRNGDYIIIPY